MNISHDGITVRFKTETEELFLAEKSGVKPNTVRIIDNDEYEMLNTHTPKKIIIQYKQEIFLRTLTHLHFSKLFGHVIVIFSWTNEGHYHTTLNETGPDPYAHTMSLDQLNPVEKVEAQSLDERFAAITISNGTLALLQRIAHGRTMNSIIRMLYEAYLNKKEEGRGPLHD